MTKSARTSLAILAVLAAGLTLASCADNQPTRFYTLSPLTDASDGKPPKALADLTIGVGPVTLPPYLDRPQLVTRVGGNRMVLADFDSWVEPLQGMFARVLGENLALLLGTDDVLMLPQRRDVTLDRQVEVDVTRFDVDDAGNAVLDARWWVYGRNGDKLLRSGRSTITEPTHAGDYTAAAAALSRALGAMSQELAQAIADQAGT
jgi:uncharacterized lipoprotein YmbA